MLTVELSGGRSSEFLKNISIFPETIVNFDDKIVSFYQFS